MVYIQLGVIDASDEAIRFIEDRPPEGINPPVYVVDIDPVNEILKKQTQCDGTASGIWFYVGTSYKLVSQYEYFKVIGDLALAARIPQRRGVWHRTGQCQWKVIAPCLPVAPRLLVERVEVHPIPIGDPAERG